MESSSRRYSIVDMSNPDEVKEFYANDIVYRFDKNKKIIFGVVVNSYEALNDLDDEFALEKGQIRVLWFNNSRDQLWRQNRVRLMNRSVIPGDIVRRHVNGKETQRGYCKDAKQYATVQIVGTDRVIEKVSSDRLNCVCPFNYDAPVCLEDKFGRVQAVDSKLVMLSKCGSTVEITYSINTSIMDYWLTKRNRYYNDSFYPGQEVICVPLRLEDAHWIHKTKSLKRRMQNLQRFTVQSVEITSVEVAWYDAENKEQFVDIRNGYVKLLQLPQPINNYCLELADRRMLKLSTSDALIKKNDWIYKQTALHRPDGYKVRHIVNRGTSKTPKYRRASLKSPTIQNVSPDDGDDEWCTEDGEQSDEESTCSSVSSSRHRRKCWPPKPQELVPGNTLAVEVLCIESRATIVWQDGTEEADIPTTQLYYSISLDDHEFFPGEWVVLNLPSGANSKEYGAIQTTNYLERTVIVKWFRHFCSEGEEYEPQYVRTDEMSVYDLKKHPKYGFRPGSVVSHKPALKWMIGHVIDSSPEGYVIVRWLDGTYGNCWPQNLEVVPETAEFDFMDSDSSYEQASWETESVQSIAGDATDETTLQNMAAKLDFIRNRILYLKDAFKTYRVPENFAHMRNLLLVYDNSSYLDKLLDTSFFSLKSRHFQMLLTQVRERAKELGVELRGRLFSGCESCSSSIPKSRSMEKENIDKILKLELKVIADIENSEREAGEPSTPITPDTDSSYASLSHENLCVELLSMLKTRMDLAYAEIISRIGGPDALSVMTKASENIITPSSTMASIPTSPDDSLISPQKTRTLSVDLEQYMVLDEAPVYHQYYKDRIVPNDNQKFLKAIQNEGKLLMESLPPGVWVRGYSNRLDLLSIMILGPNKTPYEDGLFLFDVQLGSDYPRSPPNCHYISFSSERLNPNLYVEGKVCVSLLGTWMGRGTEVWGPSSTLLQLIVSIQGLILVSEPYYNEAGYEKQTDSQQGYENSRTYNELVTLKLVQSMTELILSMPSVFREEISAHFRENGQKFCDRLELWLSIDADALNSLKPPPEFPLLPVSKGLKLSLSSALKSFKSVLNNAFKGIENASHF